MADSGIGKHETKDKGLVSKVEHLANSALLSDLKYRGVYLFRRKKLSALQEWQDIFQLLSLTSEAVPLTGISKKSNRWGTAIVGGIALGLGLYSVDADSESIANNVVGYINGTSNLHIRQIISNVIIGGYLTAEGGIMLAKGYTLPVMTSIFRYMGKAGSTLCNAGDYVSRHIHREKRVLVGDDERNVRDIFEYDVKSHNPRVKVSTVSNAEDLVQEATSYYYDFVITDYRYVGELNGVDAIRQIRERKPNVPICLVSADPPVREAKEAGANHVLDKNEHTNRELKEVLKMYI